MIGPPTNSASGELPAEQQRQDDAELDDEVGGGDLERHRRGEVRALAEQRAGQRDGGVGARRRRRAEARWRRRGCAAGRHPAAGRSTRTDDRLDDRRQREAEDQRPQDLPRHRAGDPQCVQDGVPGRRSTPGSSGRCNPSAPPHSHPHDALAGWQDPKTASQPVRGSGDAGTQPRPSHRGRTVRQEPDRPSPTRSASARHAGSRQRNGAARQPKRSGHPRRRSSS